MENLQWNLVKLSSSTEVVESQGEVTGIRVRGVTRGHDGGGVREAAFLGLLELRSGGDLFVGRT